MHQQLEQTTAAAIIGGAWATIAASDVASGGSTALFTYNGDTFLEKVQVMIWIQRSQMVKPYSSSSEQPMWSLGI